MNTTIYDEIQASHGRWITTAALSAVKDCGEGNTERAVLALKLVVAHAKAMDEMNREHFSTEEFYRRRELYRNQDQ